MGSWINDDFSIRDDKGGIAKIAAAAFGLFAVLAAITVDVASLTLAGRTLQGAADLAALAAASDLDQAHTAAELTAEANVGAVEVVTRTGVYHADPTINVENRFVEGAAVPNAVRVTISQSSQLYFGRWILGRDAITLSRTALAAVPTDRPRAMFSIGSRLASLEGGVANAILSGLTGGSVSLSVMDYNRLADARVNVLGFTRALSTELDLQDGDYDALLSAEIDAGKAFRAIRDLPGDQGDVALGKLIGPASGKRVPIRELIGAEEDTAFGLEQGLDSSVPVLDLVMATLETGGARQVALNLGARPGLALIDARLAIGERPNHSPWLTVTGDRLPIIRTTQMRLYIKVQTSQKLAGLAQVNLPILLEMASSEARLNSIACAPEAVELGVRPGLARARIGAIDEARLDDFTSLLRPAPATLLSVAGLVRVTGSADIEAADTGFRSVRFNAQEIASQRVKTVTASGLFDGVVSSLIERLNVNVQVGGLGLNLGNLRLALEALLSPLGPTIDAIINPILDFVGLGLGQADVRVPGLACPKERGSRAVLVG